MAVTAALLVREVIRVGAVYVFVFLLSGFVALGQMNTGEISGEVQDVSHSAIPDAIITAEHVETGQKFTAVSNGSGEYLFAQVPVGAYSLTVSATNFNQATLSRIEIHAGDRLRRDFILQVGDITEVVVVREGPGGLELESAEIRDVIGRQQVVNLPVKTRQFLDLAMLSPGVVRPPGGTRGDAMQQAGNLVNVLGQRSGHNLYLLDGVAITDEHFN